MLCPPPSRGGVLSKVKNASTLPKVYYGLHMAPGVAEYREPDAKPYRIFIDEDTIKNMDASFQGRPVYVEHVPEVDLTNIQAEADGYVVESFFNKCDGKHWAKFIIVSDRGHEAIRSGWKLSNAYMPKTFSSGGLWHGVEFDKKVESGEYEHLAIVPNPRYEESVILTPEQFKSYNEDKEIDLRRVANSKEKETGSMLNFFKKTKMENSTDLESMTVVLPKSKVEKTVAQVLNEMDDMYKKDQEKDPKAPAMANGDHHVMVGKEQMSVNDLVTKHLALKSALDGGEEQAEKDKAASDLTENDDETLGEKIGFPKENAESDADDKMIDKKKEEDKKQNASDVEAAALVKAAKAAKAANFEKIKNAREAALASKQDPMKVDLDKTARGKERYGSSN